MQDLSKDIFEYHTEKEIRIQSAFLEQQLYFSERGRTENLNLERLMGMYNKAIMEENYVWINRLDIILNTVFSLEEREEYRNVHKVLMSILNEGAY